MLDDRSPHDSLHKDLYTRDEAPPHPGEVLRDDILPALGLSKAELARALGLSRAKLAGLLAERTPVTLDLAFRLGIVLGHGARYWLGLQMQHDVWCAAQGAPDLSKLKPLKRPIKKAAAPPKPKPAATKHVRAGFR